MKTPDPVARERPLVLTVDDDPDLAAVVSLHLHRWGFIAASVGSAAELRTFLGVRTPDVLLLDVMLEDGDGSELVAEVKHRFPLLPVVMITASNSVETAVRSMKHGAADYITKPLDFDRLHRAVEEGLELGRLSSKVAGLSAQGTRAGDEEPPREGFGELVGASRPMRELYQRLEALAPTGVAALILGETGTGKELVARAIHQGSPRRQGPFVPVNAAAIPSELLESALFGHRKGAFTGALQDHTGYCEQADGGTLFLDEIGEMSPEAQAKLLRFLQDHVVQPVGAVGGHPVDVRVLAATNIDPLPQIAAGKLREDLYYRLRVVSLRLPPLRDRGDDLELLARHFLELSARRHARDFEDIGAQALGALEAYPWPGNVRELANVVEEAVVLHHGSVLSAAMLPPEVLSGGGSSLELSPRQARERRELEEALAAGGGDPEAAAEGLGISRATVYRRLKKYGLPRKRA